ncbi:aliphatic sulfonate ABC transporter substrate-binding protein [Cellulomonas sp. Sa3CUA2]|uniref:Aliphatic sulfonate ABC transporter substrate-binding protein n=1 Tax=Cellulomonas avistercoris TaxID=2762242 RepID=A0ABR8QE22_9CELL|nr:aliphatic sulfonate ABC transporter substrate-binding protein [Cellulomonas avistercoris]MBD7918687.1 aliphatic sulfonate ABC transporter substrate-binding protein [Cellulomonas avistercoris]
MSPTRRPRTPALLVTALVTGLGAALTLAACTSTSSATGDAASADASGPDVLRIGYQLIPNGDLVVKHEGWLEEALPGTDVQWIRFDSGGDVNTAVVAGSVDVGLAGSSPVTRGLSKPLDIDYRVLWVHDVIGDAESLVARDGSGVSSVADLAGRTIATPFASTAHYSLTAALAEAGVGEDDVRLVDLQPADILGAWTRGDVDAAYVWEPTLSELGGTVLTTSTQVAQGGHPTYDLGVVTRAFADEHPDAVDAWLEAQDRAVALLQDDPDAAAEAIGAELDLPTDEVTTQLAGLTFLRGSEQAGETYFGTPDAPGAFAASLASAAQFLHAQGAIDAVPDVADLQDRIAVDALARVFGGR